jgi:hypothetical protein
MVHGLVEVFTSANSRVTGQPRSSTPWSRMAAVMRGTKVSAISLWISRVSMALQTPGRCTLALMQIFSAISKSALASTKVWQTPL